MEFAYSHVVCNWGSDGAGVSLIGTTYDNIVVAKQQEGPLPPPLPPRRRRKPRPTSLPLPPLPFPLPPLSPLSLPPPVPPRIDKLRVESKLKANVNIVSLSIGKLVDISQATGMETSPVICGKCSAALSCLSSIQSNVWLCEFCGCENSTDDGVNRVCIGERAGVRSDDLYLPTQSEDDYQNLEDTLVVFCVDISGSMCVTTEVTSSSGSSTHISRLEGVQDALQKTLSSMLQLSPHRRVALVTFNDEVVIYGDGTSTPLTLRDWALVDYDHIWEKGTSYSIPHCIAETYTQLMQTVKDLREHGATCLGPAALASVAMASRYPGSKVILCTDGRANIGLGEMNEASSLPSSPHSSYFYRKLALQAVGNGVIISVMTFEGTECCLADIGRLADTTGGRVNIINMGNVATEIQSASMDNVLATGVTAKLLASDGVFFPYEDENNHKVVREIGNVTKGLEITFQFSVQPEFKDFFLQKATLPFQLQLSFKTRDQQRVTRIITERRPIATCSRILADNLNVAVLGVHCAQLCASLTMEGRVQEAQEQLKAQQDLLKQISMHRPIQKEESIYGNWMDTMTTICDDITTESQSLSDEAAKVVYQMKRASSVSNHNSNTNNKQKNVRKKKTLMEGM
ncbi:circularly permutated Ras protein 1 [Mastacembelus armatus]|uniref:circularly permutated Ras protein 1 n=1 Tax=Mastacembelus armatus TaxID=205130 RepID=UPI000E4646F4|nr:circularly permutated Ras protein 1-like [Mastacembelus armatus]XP_026154264.1 circularly permutated Ras protein 1-like [Mastacembelus armatus]XP_026154265.1 circularly permutated Ras protein 1-like [Mastacembelus armatus]XP_026154266.1 circularly permutated Ras protein 1-like [Mastacembelus armatus]